MPYARPSLPNDPWELAPCMRVDDVAEVKAASGLRPLEALIDGYEMSEQCFSVISDDDRVIGMMGLAPTAVPDVGIAWMLCADDIFKASKEILRQVGPFLDMWHRRYRILMNFVDARNTMHLKWCRRAGFQAVNLIEKHGLGQLPFYEIIRYKSNV